MSNDPCLPQKHLRHARLYNIDQYDILSAIIPLLQPTTSLADLL